MILPYNSYFMFKGRFQESCCCCYRGLGCESVECFKNLVIVIEFRVARVYGFNVKVRGIPRIRLEKHNVEVRGMGNARKSKKCDVEVRGGGRC